MLILGTSTRFILGLFKGILSRVFIETLTIKVYFARNHNLCNQNHVLQVAGVANIVVLRDI